MSLKLNILEMDQLRFILYLLPIKVGIDDPDLVVAYILNDHLAHDLILGIGHFGCMDLGSHAQLKSLPDEIGFVKLIFQH